MNAPTNPNFLQRMHENVLLQGLAPLMTKRQWHDRLLYEPLKRARHLISTRQDQEACLQIFHTHFIPTRQTCIIAEQIHRLLLNGLVGRDRRDLPLDTHTEARSTGSANSAWNPVTVSGMVLKSMTRQGKTHLINRVFETFPQVIERVDPWPGQKTLKQLVYLIVPMPSNASKKGFIYSAMLEMDKALGTHYAERFDRRVSAEVELVKLVNLLKAHRCGMLVVEECQVQNELGGRTFGADFATFFLSVLNSGIPTLIVGNTKAFAAIEHNSQIMCRLSEGGLFDLHPASSSESEGWLKDYMHCLWGATIFDLPDEPIANLAEVIWRATGGFCHFLARLRADALRLALEGGADHVRAVDVSGAIERMRQSGARKLIDAFVNRDTAALAKFKDIDHDYYVTLWAHDDGARKKAEEEAGKTNSPPKPKRDNSADSKKKRASRATPAKKSAKPAGSAGDFAPEDVRSLPFLKSLERHGPGDGAAA